MNARGKATPRIGLRTLFRFGQRGTLDKGVAAVSLPRKNLDVRRDEQRRTFALHFSAPGLIRDARGQVVRRFQRDFRLVRELDRPDNHRAGNFALAEPFELAPGRYTVESAVMDWISGRMGARRAEFVAAPAQGGRHRLGRR